MAEQPAPTIRRFEDLVHADADLLRQVASRVHIIDLAYALATASNEVQERFYGSIRPNLAAQIRSAILTVMAPSTRTRFMPDEQIRVARARVMETARHLLPDSE